MAVRPDRHAYLVSLGSELDVQAQRIRQLLGDAHWLSDGHHKEALLRGLLERHLPSTAVCTRGFVVDPGRADARSKEQDILIIDPTAEAPLFNQGGLCVCFPSSVLAAVSVKSSFRSTALKDAFRGLLERDVLLKNPNPDSQ